MRKNDDKIKKLLSEIEAKRKALGSKPRAIWKTNGVLLGTNINTINSTAKCIELAAQFVWDKYRYIEACKFLELPAQNSEEKISFLNDALDDIKLRCQMVLWDIEKKKLEAMENRLKDLRSEDAKTEDALADIEKSLV